MSTFITQNKVRPGVYLNFESVSESLSNIADRGTVLLPLELDFLEIGQIIKTNVYTNFLSEFGISINDKCMIPVREALKNAETVMIYRVNSGEKACVITDDLNIMANYEGEYGNNISVEILEKNEGGFIINTYVFDEIHTTEEVESSVTEYKNALVTLFGNFVSTEKIDLGNGRTDKATELMYENFFETALVLEFNTFAVLTDDTNIKSSALSFVKNMRDTQGNKIQCVMSDCASADYEGVISVSNGVILEDETEISSITATAYVAGAIAGCDINESLTYKTYIGASDVSPKYANDVICEKLENGEFLFTSKRNKVIIEQDINTFTGFSPSKSNVFAKNRVIRVIDNIATDIKTLFEDYYLGKVSNNEKGRGLFTAECVNYLRNLEELACIEGFEPMSDINVLAGDDLDSICVNLNIKPVDSIEKLYMTVVLG